MLNKVIRAGFQEYDLAGCPLVRVGGLECVALFRVELMLGVSRVEAARRLGAVPLPAYPGGPVEDGPLFSEPRQFPVIGKETTHVD